MNKNTLYENQISAQTLTVRTLEFTTSVSRIVWTGDKVVMSLIRKNGGDLVWWCLGLKEGITNTSMKSSNWDRDIG